MANWKHRLDLKAEHNDVHNGILQPWEYAKRVAKKMRALEMDEDKLEEWLDIASDFEAEAQNHECTFDDTDEVLDRLYDFGDYEHTCWIATF